MIAMLRFKPEPSGAFGGRLVREARFERITDLPISTVCVTANQARTQLSKLLARELTLDVFAPVLLDEGTEVAVLFEHATVFAARGGSCDICVVFRPRDARRIAASAFGEQAAAEDAPLSGLEERALERVAQEVAALCVPFSGDMLDVHRIDPALDVPACATYFELRIGAPLDAIIGIGLSKDPGPKFGATIERATLAGVALAVRAEFAEATVDAAAVSAWAIGTMVRLDTKIGAPTRLKVGNCVVASGDCGIRADSNAVAIRRSLAMEGAL